MSHLGSQEENTAMYRAMEATGNLREGDRERYETFLAAWLAGRDWARAEIRKTLGIEEDVSNATP